MSYRYAIALTGGIATGKSTVVSLLGLHGLRTIDADKIAHELLDHSSAWVANTFGLECVRGGKVDRGVLGPIIFASADARATLESYLHPKIRERIDEESLKHDRLGFAYLIDIPLFFETHNYPIEHSVVVYTPYATQLERLMARNHISADDAAMRIAMQMDIEEKKTRATWVIDNTSTLKHLQKECEHFVEIVCSLYPRS